MHFRKPWLILISAASFAITPQVDVRQLVDQMISANQRSAQQSSQWLGREDIRHYVTTANGRRKQTSWLTYEAMVLEGEAYYRLTAVNGKALPKRLERLEQKRLDEETTYRHGVPPSERQYHGPRIGFRLSEATLAHDLRLLGTDQLSGRKAWVVEGRLRQDARMPHSALEGALACDFAIWIDQETKESLREEYRLRRPFHSMQPGSVGVKDYDLRPDAKLASKWTLRMVSGSGATGETEQIYSNYRKFEAIAAIEYETAQ